MCIYIYMYMCVYTFCSMVAGGPCVGRKSIGSGPTQGSFFGRTSCDGHQGDHELTTVSTSSRVFWETYKKDTPGPRKYARGWPSNSNITNHKIFLAHALGKSHIGCKCC